MLEHPLTKLYPLRQVAQWVYEYLQAPISLREIVEDTGAAGASHRPALLHTRPSVAGGETRFRRCVGLEIAEQAARYLLRDFRLLSTSCIPLPASCILHPASFILHHASCILHHASCILHPASCTLHPASCILRLLPPYLATYPSLPTYRRRAGRAVQPLL